MEPAERTYSRFWRTPESGRLHHFQNHLPSAALVSITDLSYSSVCEEDDKIDFSGNGGFSVKTCFQFLLETRGGGCRVLYCVEAGKVTHRAYKRVAGERAPWSV